MDDSTRDYLLSLVAHDMCSGKKTLLRDHVPDWVFRKDRGDDKIVHDGRWVELVWCKTERARAAFDEVARAHPKEPASRAWVALRHPRPTESS